MLTRTTKSALLLASILCVSSALPMNDPEAKTAALALLHNFKNNVTPFFDAATGTLNDDKVQLYAEARNALNDTGQMKGVQALRNHATTRLLKERARKAAIDQFFEKAR